LKMYPRINMGAGFRRREPFFDEKLQNNKIYTRALFFLYTYNGEINECASW